MSNEAVRRLLLCLGLTLAVVAGPVARAEEEGISAAEKLLFDTDHLANVGSPTRLEYRYLRDGNDAFTDRVALAVDAGRKVVPDYLSGAHHVSFPEIEDVHGNPLLLFFLEDDLRDMQRRTQGQADYFRRLIRRAMAKTDLPVETTEVTVGGHRMPAQRIVIEPFRADPAAPLRYPALAGKSYEFVLAAAVPGQIVSLTSRVALGGGKTETVRVEWIAPDSM